ncbi:MAG: dihydrofolate synthase / folylpolyglutamate synthase [Solirubrobacteraceae bacterium]|jgi:dihydrofolate synthase/folylpolyglutamate synthase|nr:dihydrofolate synthase / folylpolyglutamate synthase [Solirubrobacteraceae bacterium]
MTGAWTAAQAEEHLLALELFGMRFGLDRMRRLMTALGSPERSFESIHVVGTNGKSSTVRMTEALLARHGLRAGSYTSPHLVSFTERVRVDGEPVADAEFAAAVQRAARAAEAVNRTRPADDGVTQFELLTAAAYCALADRGVEAVVVEAGLGGRFDATNTIPSRVQVLTNVGLEHTRWLGPTVTDIAREKLDVVRDEGVLVVGELAPEAEAQAVAAASRHRARLVRAPAALPDVTVSAPGAFQRRNFAVAATAAGAFLARDAVTDASAALAALDPVAVREAAAAVSLAGRCEVIADDPLTVVDGAHNPAGARALASTVPELVGERAPVVAVISVLEDKDAAGMLRELLAFSSTVVFTRSANPRALPPATLESLARQVAPDPPAIELRPDPRAALARARELAGPGGAVVATGSIYLVADLARGAESRRASTL